MKNILFRIRSILELISLPAFIFLVTHLSGHGAMLIFGGHHGHDDHGHHGDHAGHAEGLFTPETLIGLGFLILFVWIWHRPSFRRWVPCAHHCCTHESQTPHMLAIIALCLHFFPEAGVRHELLHNQEAEGVLHFVSAAGFLAHFFVDVIIGIMISLYWNKAWQSALTFVIIAASWIAAFFVGPDIIGLFPPSAEAALFLTSGFLLAMFVHKPHGIFGKA